MTLTIDLLRHARTLQSDRLLGRTDAPVDQSALADVDAQAGRCRWTRVVASPLGRCRATAQRLSAAVGLPIVVEAEWAEMDFGQWDGRPLADLRGDAAYQSFLVAPERTGPPAGESWQDFTARIDAALRRRLDDPDGRTVVVTHGGAIRAALAVTTGLPFDSLWRLRIDPATRVTLRCGRSSGAWWGEIVEIVQP